MGRAATNVAGLVGHLQQHPLDLIWQDGMVRRILLCTKGVTKKYRENLGGRQVVFPDGAADMRWQHGGARDNVFRKRRPTEVDRESSPRVCSQLTSRARTSTFGRHTRHVRRKNQPLQPEN